MLLALGLLALTSAQKLSSRRISSSVKDDILNADSFSDAYNKYMEAYTDPEDKLLLASTDPVSLRHKRFAYVEFCGIIIKHPKLWGSNHTTSM